MHLTHMHTCLLSALPGAAVWDGCRARRDNHMHTALWRYSERRRQTPRHTHLPHPGTHTSHTPHAALYGLGLYEVVSKDSGTQHGWFSTTRKHSGHDIKHAQSQNSLVPLHKKAVDVNLHPWIFDWSLLNAASPLVAGVDSTWPKAGLAKWVLVMVAMVTSPSDISKLCAIVMVTSPSVSCFYSPTKQKASRPTVNGDWVCVTLMQAYMVGLFNWFTRHKVHTSVW